MKPFLALAVSIVLIYSSGGAYADLVTSYNETVTSGSAESGLLMILPAEHEGPSVISYDYCYLASTNGKPASISVYYDNTVIDKLTFFSPNHMSCSPVEDTHSRRVVRSNESISGSVKLMYTNGDYRISVANIRVMSPEKEAEEADPENQTENKTTQENRTISILTANGTEKTSQDGAEANGIENKGLFHLIADFFRKIF